MSGFTARTTGLLEGSRIHRSLLTLNLSVSASLLLVPPYLSLESKRRSSAFFPLPWPSFWALIAFHSVLSSLFSLWYTKIILWDVFLDHFNCLIYCDSRCLVNTFVIFPIGLGFSCEESPGGSQWGAHPQLNVWSCVTLSPSKTLER